MTVSRVVLKEAHGLQQNEPGKKKKKNFDASLGSNAKLEYI